MKIQRSSGLVQHRLRNPGASAITALLALTSVTAYASTPTEYEVKAAYLYNFGKFVQWPSVAPSERGTSFNICVLGQDPFGSALYRTVAGETIDGKSVIVRGIATPEDAAECRIVFVSGSENGALPDVLAALDAASVLTVSDIPAFLEHGGMIHFVLSGNRVRFEVNLAAARRAGLTLSSQLLKLALRVKPDAQTER